MNDLKLNKQLKQFLEEDIGDGDLTSRSIFPSTKYGKGLFIVKETGVLAGLRIIEDIYNLLDSKINVTLHYKDGDRVEKGATIATIHGPVAHLLTGERVILNLIQRMSGIATATNKSVKILKDPAITL